MKNIKTGNLYIVATPIGNLKDISQRGLEVLKDVDLIAAEDTRHSKIFLAHYAISTPLVAVHEHNEESQNEKLIEKLKEGKSLALISDAGTPLVSDPGYRLVQAAYNNNISVVPIPGACAAITALSGAGLPTDQFSFLGFLPAKNSAKKTTLENYVTRQETLIFYESPHRILETLECMQEVLGSDRFTVVARELTKMYETFHRGSLKELCDWFANHTEQQRGEMVILIQGAAKTSDPEKNEVSTDHVLSILLADLPLKQAVELAAKITSNPKNYLYDQALKIKKSS